MIIQIKKGMNDEIRQVAEIHHAILPKSMMTRLGKKFLTEVYYPVCIEDSRFHCFASIYEGRVAGFMTLVTKGGSGGLIMLLFKRPVALLSALSHMVFHNPKACWWSLQIIFHLGLGKKEPLHEIPCELVSSGVLPEFRSAEFVKKTGRRLSRELYLNLVQFMLDHEIPRLKGFTLKQDILTNANVKHLGFKPQFTGRIPGRNPVNELIAYVWEMEEAAKKFGLSPSKSQTQHG
ncbi:MAG: hypothetical protein ACE5G9_05280 [Nitrospinales bacterium]